MHRKRAAGRCGARASWPTATQGRAPPRKRRIPKVSVAVARTVPTIQRMSLVLRHD